EPSQPGEIPLPGGLVESQLFVQGRNALRGGLLAEDRSSGVAGQQQGGAEDEQGDCDEDERGEEQPLTNDFSEHVRPLRSIRGRISNRSADVLWSWERALRRISGRRRPGWRSPTRCIRLRRRASSAARAPGPGASRA